MNANRKRPFGIVAFLCWFVFVTPGLAIAADKAELIAFFKDLCEDCHGGTRKHNLKFARFGYDESAHKKGGNSFYANGDGCQRCHTHEGFIEYLKTGKIDPKSYINLNPE
jgi:hypothetical protein